ncbi:polyphenol oxidase family protein [Limnobacter sp.]|uniref:polyphenol oxidase family protein n=1 Tax=Limnobacter sp. TaxID=2003368 RepID=UPI00374900D9
MTMMTSKKSNKFLPLAEIGPNWLGVKVCVTQTGFGDPAFDTGPFGFNLGTHVGDELDDVENRRSVVQQEMGAAVLWLNQVHGCDVFDASLLTNSHGLGAMPPSADASTCVNSNVALAIMTADCLPAVFAAFDYSGKAIGVAAAHAGWRGLHAGVLQATAKALGNACNVPMGQIKVWLGPAIGPESFEVGSEVLNAFVQKITTSSMYFKPAGSDGKFLANIYGLARCVLDDLGVGKVQVGDWDTVTDLRWFSHRRGQQQGVPSGRFATLIRLLPEQVV